MGSKLEAQGLQGVHHGRRWCPMDGRKLQDRLCLKRPPVDEAMSEKGDRNWKYSGREVQTGRRGLRGRSTPPWAPQPAATGVLTVVPRESPLPSLEGFAHPQVGKRRLSHPQIQNRYRYRTVLPPLGTWLYARVWQDGKWEARGEYMRGYTRLV